MKTFFKVSLPDGRVVREFQDGSIHWIQFEIPGQPLVTSFLNEAGEVVSILIGSQLWKRVEGGWAA